MPTLVLENVPGEVYESLRKRAAASQQSVPEVMLELLEQFAREDKSPTPRLPELIDSEEAHVYFDLPRSSQPVQVLARLGQPRLPDPLPEDEDATE